jgi:GMP synthase (glutamine-hydrolysing) B subunit
MAVGENFITVRDRVVEAQHLDPEKWMLAQGTLYPDIIESGGTKNSHTIKTHHNRVQGIQELIAKGMIIEPVRDLYKDEVRAIGKKLGLPDELVMRHPFPGPGLSINVLCSDGQLNDKDKEEIQLAQKELDNIKLDMFCEKCSAGLKRSILPVRSVGVQGDFRTYRFPALLEFRAETSGGSSTGSGTFVVYPNPANNILFVETRLIASLPDQTYRIINLMGQTLLQGHISAETQQIDISTLPSGMYFINVGETTLKFVIR